MGAETGARRDEGTWSEPTGCGAGGRSAPLPAVAGQGEEMEPPWAESRCPIGRDSS